MANCAAVRVNALSWGLALVICTAFIALSGCATRDEHPRAVVESRENVLARFASVRTRLAELKKRGVDPDSYHYALVQAWGDFAWDTFHQQDNSGIVYFLLRRGERQLDEMERATGSLPYVVKPIVEDVRVRSDLWEIAARFKAHPGFRCAAARVAQLEVKLLAAGHAQQELGWRHAKPYVLAAERLERSARRRLESCAPRAAPVTPKQAHVEFSRDAERIEKSSAIAPLETGPTADVYRDSILFAPGSVELDAKAEAVLGAIAQLMLAQPDIVLDLRLPADTTPVGADWALIMERRVRAVREYLIDSGVGAERLRIQSSAIPAGAEQVNGVPAVAVPAQR